MIDTLKLTTYDKWQKPTVAEVATVLITIERIMFIDDLYRTDELYQLLGMGERSVRRWKEKHERMPNELSTIPYASWCVLVALSCDNKCIFSKTLNKEKRIRERIPKKYICSAVKFKSPPIEILKQFIGKHSFTGMTRSELAGLFGWHLVSFSKMLREERITYTNWMLLLQLCGLDIKSLIIGNK